jgi:hypothetical protein
MNYNYVKLSKLKLLRLKKWQLIDILDACGVNQQTLKEKFERHVKINNWYPAHEEYMRWRFKLADTYQSSYKDNYSKYTLPFLRIYYRLKIRFIYKYLKKVERTLFALKDD